MSNLGYTPSGIPLWTQLGQDIDGESSFDESGNSVSLSSDGSALAIGATGSLCFSTC